MQVPERSKRIIQDTLEPYTAILTVQYGGRIGPHSSGVFFAIDDNYFIVTAGHAIADVVKHKATLYIASDAEVGRAFALRGNWFAVDNFGLDIAIYKLSPEEKAKLAARKFARSSDCLPSDPPSGTWVLLYGALNECSETWSAGDPNPTSRLATGAFVSRITESEDVPQSFNKGLQHCCDADWDWHGLKDKKLIIPNSIKGMSGCAAWAVQGDPSAENWILDIPLLCGIQSGVITPNHKGEQRAYCRIIKWGVAIELIRRYFPSVATVEGRLSSFQVVRFTSP